MAIPTLFSTFYSFKGGVGRTLSLVNTAVELTRRGHPVIIWDMDIEAPGIQHIPYFEKLTGKIKGGFLDIAEEFIKNNCKEINNKKFNDYIVTHPDNPNLHLLSAGNLEDENQYYQRFTSLHWDKLFGVGKKAGFRLFELIQQAVSNYHPDFVLIDSISGYTDIGGICCFQLPDVVFLVFSYGNQNTKGIREIYNALDNKDLLRKLRPKRPLKTSVISSMIPTDRPDLWQSRRTWLKEHFPFLNVDIEIPFNTEMAFNETVWPAEYQDHQFCQYYEQIADILVVERNILFPEVEKTLTKRKIKYDEESALPHVSPAEQFKQNTAQLFRLMGYEVDLSKSINDSQMDIFLTTKTPIETNYYIVECKHWEKNVDKPVVEEVGKKLESVHTRYPECRAIIAAKKGFTRESQKYAESLHITVKTYDELLRGIINFDRYVSYIKNLYAGTELEKNYIPQDVIVENTDSTQSLLKFANQWLSEPQGGFFTILGDFGTGKTSFTRRLAHDLTVKYEKDKTGARIPVLINLKDVSKALSLEKIISDHFSRTANMDVLPEVFFYLLKEGKIILIFDGFDEMATQSNAALTRKNFMELKRAFTGKAKILLTCRTHYFKDRAETEETVQLKKKGMTESATELYRAIQGEQGYTLGYLQEFKKEQIEEYLKKTLPKSWQESKGLIDKVYNLKDLASRPVLLDMIVKSLPAIKEKQKNIQVTDLYSAYVQSWIDRDDWRHELTREGREFLAEEIAWRLWDQDTDRIHYSDINEMLKDYFKEKKTVVDSRELEYTSSEVRTASFLTRDEEGNYGFAHRSFLEYFLARRIARKLNNNDIKVLDIKRLSREVILFLSRICGIENLVKTCRYILSLNYQKRISENSLFIFYWSLRYFHSQDGRIKDPQQLKELFSSPRYRPGKMYLREADLAGGEFSYMDFSESCLEKVNMEATILTGVSLKNAVLNQANLSFVLLDEADLSGVKARQTVFHHASFKKARLVDADFSESDIHACNFMEADLQGAQFTGSDLSYAGLLGASGDITQQLSYGNVNINTYGMGLPRTRVRELQPAVQLGHGDCIRFSVFSPDGKTVVSASYDHRMKLWDPATGRLIHTLTGHSAPVYSTTFSPDGTTLVSASSDQSLKLWDAKTGALLRTLNGHSKHVNFAAFSPDGTILVSASSDHSLKLWDATTGNLIRTLTGHSDIINTAAFSPDGTILISASYDNSVNVWDAKTGALLRTLKDHHKGSVNTAFFSPNGTTLVSASSDQSLKLWDAKTYTLLRTLTGHSAIVNSAAFSPDGTILVSASDDGSVQLWDSKTGTLLRTFTEHSSRVWYASFSPDGATLVSASDDESVKLWDSKTGTLLRTLTGHPAIIRFVSFSPDGTTLVSASDDESVQLWDSKTGTLLRTLTEHSLFVNSADFSPDGKTLILTSSDHSLKLWDVQSRSNIRTLTGHLDIVWSAAFSPDGKILVSASEDKTLKLWDAQSGTNFRTLSGHSLSVNSASFSPNGTTLVSASSDHSLKLWDAKTGVLLRTLNSHSRRVNFAAFSPDGNTLVSASYDNTIKLWDAKTGILLRTLTGHSSNINTAAFFPDGIFIASASSDNSLRLWETQTGKEITALKNLPTPRSVSLSKDGKHLCVGTDEGMFLIKVIYKGKKIQNLEIAATFYHLPGHEWLVVGADNRFACSEGGRSYLYFRDQLALYPASDFPELESKNVLD